jgi:hypothetical protein
LKRVNNISIPNNMKKHLNAGKKPLKIKKFNKKLNKK